MTIEEHIEFWIESAENDFSVAELLIESGNKENYSWLKSLLK